MPLQCEDEILDMLRPGAQLDELRVGHSLSEVLQLLKASSCKPVKISFPSNTTTRHPILVIAKKENGCQYIARFDAHKQIALSVGIESGANGKDSISLAQSEDVTRQDSFIIGHVCPALPVVFQDVCNQLGQRPLDASFEERSTGYTARVLFDGVVVTVHRSFPPEALKSSILPPSPIPRSIEDLKNAEVFIKSVQVIPKHQSSLYHLSVGEGGGRGLVTSSVQMIVSPSTCKIVGIKVTQPCSRTFHGSSSIISQVYFGDSIEKVLRELGSPERVYYRSADNGQLFSFEYPKKVRSSSKESNHRSDTFFNYLSLGLDVMFARDELSVRKIILHSNTPLSADFGTYSRCHFQVACCGGALSCGAVSDIHIGPHSKWSTCVSQLGRGCKPLKIVHHKDLEHLGHTHPYHVWYSVMGQLLVEVVSDHIHTCCILPDIADSQTFSAGLPPEEPLSTSLSQGSHATKEHLAANSLLSQEDFDDASSNFATPEGSISATQKVVSHQPIPAIKKLENVNIIAENSNISKFDLAAETSSEDDVITCVGGYFTESESDDESSSQSEDSTAEASEECFPVEDAENQPSSLNAAEQSSLTSDFDVLSLTLNKGQLDESSGVSTSPSGVSTSPSGVSTSSSVVEKVKPSFEYKPASNKPSTAGRLGEIQKSTTPHLLSNQLEKRTENQPTKVKQNKNVKQKGKFALSEKESKLTDRLTRPTISYLQHHTKEHVPEEQQTEDSSGLQSDHFNEKVEDEQLPTVPSGDPLLPTVPSGDPLLPTVPSGDPLLPTVPSGDPLLPTVPSGDPLLPTVPSGDPLLPTIFSKDLLLSIVPEEPDSSLSKVDKLQQTSSSTSITVQSATTTPNISLGSFQNSLLKQLGIPLDQPTGDLAVVEQQPPSAMALDQVGKSGADSGQSDATPASAELTFTESPAVAVEPSSKPGSELFSSESMGKSPGTSPGSLSTPEGSPASKRSWLQLGPLVSELLGDADTPSLSLVSL